MIVPRFQKPEGSLLTSKQLELLWLLGGVAMNTMAYGGSRSGKTFGICYRMAATADTCPGTRQAILRKHLNAVRTSIGDDTLPKVLDMMGMSYRFNKVDNKFIFPNGSSIWMIGLDDKQRTEKVLGKGFFTLYFNECSELSWESVQMALTRNAVLAEKDIYGRRRRNRMFYDCNPPSKRHWCYKAFVEKINPATNKPWPHPERWAHIQMNPRDNAENLNPEYIDGILGDFAGKMRMRFLDGIFTDENENALWKQAWIDNHRVRVIPTEFERIVIGVDPAVTNKENSDATGIVVCGQTGTEFYVLEDCTFKASPDTWAREVVRLYRKYDADRVVAETNQGGDLVLATLQAVDRNLSVRGIHAKVGKKLRGEPVAAVYEQGRVHHNANADLAELEDQMTNYVGEADEDSPDNLDAMVYAMRELIQRGGIVQTTTG